MGRASDPDLLRRARELGRMLFSQDEDMLAEAVKRQRAGEPFATVIFARQLDPLHQHFASRGKARKNR